MYEYEKGFTATVFTLAIFLGWQLLKTLFYRLPRLLINIFHK